jgi:hypothetical protein
VTASLEARFTVQLGTDSRRCLALGDPTNALSVAMSRISSTMWSCALSSSSVQVSQRLSDQTRFGVGLLIGGAGEFERAVLRP